MKKVIEGSIPDAILGLAAEAKQPMTAQEIRDEIGGDVRQVRIAIRKLSKLGYLQVVGVILCAHNLPTKVYSFTGKPHPGYYLR